MKEKAGNSDIVTEIVDCFLDLLLLPFLWIVGQ